MNLVFEPHIRSGLWITLVIAGVILLVWYGWRRPPAITTKRWAAVLTGMSFSLAALLFLLLNPTWTAPVPPPAGKPILNVLVDSSASMSTVDSGTATRFDEATKLARELRLLEDRYDVRVRSFDDSTELAGDLAKVEPAGRQTDIAGAVSSCLKEDYPQGQAIVVLSDGVHNATTGVDGVLSAARSAQAMSVPVYPTTIGGDTAPDDLELFTVRPTDLSFVEQDVTIGVSVKQRGQLTDRVNVLLVQDGEELKRQTVTVGRDATVSTKFTVNEKDAGLYRYEIRTEPIPGETTVANNSVPFLLRVVSDPIRVLVLEGKPYWDTKFLVRTLAIDPSLEVDCMIRLRDDRFLHRQLRLDADDANEDVAAAANTAGPNAGQDDNESSNTSRSESTTFIDSPSQLIGSNEALSQWQVIVLGRDAEAFLSEPLVQSLRRWVSRDGGSLVCFRGSPVASLDENLSRLMPVRWSQSRERRFRPQLTDRGTSLAWLNPAGERDGAIIANLPSLVSGARPERPRALASVLARTDSADPVVSWHSFGTGRVVAVEGAGMWRWAFLSPEYQNYEEIYATIWHSLLRWLVSGVGLTPGEQAALRTDRVSYTRGETVSATLLLRDDAGPESVPKVVLTDGSGTERDVVPVPSGDEPGVYDVRFGTLAAGRYEAKLKGETSEGASASVGFDVLDFLGEKLDVRARPDLLQRLADDSGGAMVASADIGSVGELFDQHRTANRPLRVQRVAAWDRWWVLVGILVLWVGTWTVRRRAGLV